MPGQREDMISMDHLTGKPPSDYPSCIVLHFICSDEASVKAVLEKVNELILREYSLFLEKEPVENSCVFVSNDHSAHPVQANSSITCFSTGVGPFMKKWLHIAPSYATGTSENDLSKTSCCIETMHNIKNTVDALLSQRPENGYPLCLVLQCDSCKVAAEMYSSNTGLSCTYPNGDGFVDVNSRESVAPVGALPGALKMVWKHNESNEKVSEKRYVQSTPEQDDVSDDLVPGAREKEVGVGAIPLEKSPSTYARQTDYAFDRLCWLMDKSPNHLNANSPASCIADAEDSREIYLQQAQLECQRQAAEALFDVNEADFPSGGVGENSDERRKNECTNLEFTQERIEYGTMPLKEDGDDSTEMIYTRLAHEADLDTAEDDVEDNSRRTDETVGDRLSTEQILIQGISDLCMTTELEDQPTVMEKEHQKPLPCPDMSQPIKQTASKESDLEEGGIPAATGMQDPATDLDETDVVNLHPQTYKECLTNLALLVLPGGQIPDVQTSGLSKVDDPSMMRRPQGASDMYHLYTQARRDLTDLHEKMRVFFERNDVDEKTLQEYNCTAVKELDKFIESVMSEWRSPFAEHLRDIIALPAGRAQLFRSAGLLKYVSIRFYTYVDFPACDRASPVRLAQTGFYYTGSDDITQCYQCDRQHGNWTVMDIPHLIHCYLSPHCPVVLRNEPLSSDQGEQDLLSDMQVETGAAQLIYLQAWKKKLMESNVTANSAMQTIRNMNRTGNSSGTVGQRLPSLLPVSARPALQTSTPLPQTLAPAPPLVAPVGGARGQETGDATAREGAAGNGQFSRPHANKNYATYEQRLNSFRNWPTTRSQRPDVLAHAGFFYAGSGDCVRCYHCGLGLKHWDDDDDPWLEHVRWRATCEHLIVTQGQQYVTQAFQEIVRRDREQDEIAQRFGLNEEPQNVPRPAVSNNYQDISSGNRERTTQQTSSASQPASQPPRQSSPQSAPQPTPQPTPQSAPPSAPRGAAQTAPPSAPGSAQAKAASAAKEPQQGASNNPGQLDDSPPASREGDDLAGGGDDEPIEGNEGDLSASDRDRIQQLREQNLALRQQNLCRECNKQEICMLFLPCQHLTMCEACAKNVKVCNMCRKKIKKKVKTFLS